MQTEAVASLQHTQDYSTPMRIGDFRFRPRWVPTLLIGVLMPLFLGLGVWQLERAEHKKRLAEVLSARADLAPYRLDQPVSDPGELQFRRLIARGHYEPEGQFLLENRRQGGRNGFQVVTPLRLEGSDLRVLVNRGWIPANGRGQPAPAPVPEGTVEVTGGTHIPAPPALRLHDQGPDAVAAWKGRWPYLTVDLYASSVSHPVQPVVLLLDPDEDGGFVRNWPKDPPKQAMHIGYALQWFAFALIALVIYVRFGLERRQGTGEPS